MTKAWLLNTSSSHWGDCLRGPSGEDHPKEHHRKPWHGIPDTPNPDPRKLNEGDLLIIRENGEGVRALWTFSEARRVHDQSIIPESWKEQDGERQEYRWILYCREDPIRQFPRALDEDWNNSPNIGHGPLTGTAKKSNNIIESYVEFLLNSDIPEGAKERVRDTSSRRS